MDNGILKKALARGILVGLILAPHLFSGWLHPSFLF